MDIIKQNIWSIICGVIVLIAIIVPFWPMGGYETELQDELNAKRQTYSSLEGLERRSRMMPTLDPGAKETTPLDQFPSPGTIEAGKAATEAVAQESQEIYQFAVTINRRGHELLVPRSLPSPRTPDGIAFRERYLRAFQDHLVEGILDGTAPPTPDEIKAEADRQWTEDYLGRIFTTPSGQTNEQTLRAQHAEAVAKLPEQMRRQRAVESKIYVDPGAFEVVKEIAGAGGAAPEARFIWWAQIGYWVQQDIARAIAQINAEAPNVLEAPVKRLIRIDVPQQFVQRADQQRAPGFRSGGSPSSSGFPNGQDAESAQPQDVDAPLPQDNAASATGRVSNPMFDVIHATLTLELEAEQIPAFLAQLTDGRFFTVLQVDIATVDSALLLRQGYYYGDRPVVQLKVKLEALFLREWTLAYMPDSIKTALGIPKQSNGVAMW